MFQEICQKGQRIRFLGMAVRINGRGKGQEQIFEEFDARIGAGLMVRTTLGSWPKFKGQVRSQDERGVHGWVRVHDQAWKQDQAWLRPGCRAG